MAKFKIIIENLSLPEAVEELEEYLRDKLRENGYKIGYIESSVTGNTTRLEDREEETNS